MIINGKHHDWPIQSVMMILEQMHLDPKRLVVEVNQRIVPQDHYRQHLVTKDDVVEIVRFVGGG